MSPVSQEALEATADFLIAAGELDRIGESGEMDEEVETGLSGCGNRMALPVEVSPEVREALEIRVQMFKARMDLPTIEPLNPDSGIDPQGHPRG